MPTTTFNGKHNRMVGSKINAVLDRQRFNRRVKGSCPTPHHPACASCPGIKFALPRRCPLHTKS
jgi:hypothetical protein